MQNSVPLPHWNFVQQACSPPPKVLTKIGANLPPWAHVLWTVLVYDLSWGDSCFRLSEDQLLAKHCAMFVKNNGRLPQHISCSSPYWCDHRAVPRECIRSSTRCPSEGKAWDTTRTDFWLKGPDPLIGFRYFVLQQRCDQKSTGKKEEQKNQSTFLLCFAKSRGIQIQLILYASNFF